jgi:hypothetical protein
MVISKTCRRLPTTEALGALGALTELLDIVRLATGVLLELLLQYSSV